jgi:hypothetical protein
MYTTETATKSSPDVCMTLTEECDGRLDESGISSTFASDTCIGFHFSGRSICIFLCCAALETKNLHNLEAGLTVVA